MSARPTNNQSQRSQLARYHRETLLDQIAALHDQIESNLEHKKPIRHLKDLIAERQQYLNAFDPGKANHPGMKRGL